MRERPRRNDAYTRFDDSGLGLLELVVSLFILALVLTGVAYLLTQQLQIGLDSRNRSAAANLAAAALDEARAQTDYAAIDGAEWTQTVNGQTFTLLQTVTAYLGSGSTSPCDGSTSAAIAYKRVSVRVSWPNMPSTTQPVRSDTLLTPAEISYDATKGNIAVRVRNAGGVGVEGIQVNLTRTGFSNSQFTDEQGCAFFDGLTPATYTVAAIEANYVTSQGVANPTVTATAQAGRTTAVAIDFDRAATITATLPSGTYPMVSSSLPVNLGNPGLQPNGVKQVAGSGTSRSLTNLFPYQAGYTIWVGTCSDADPGSDFPAVTVTPGATTATAVPMASVAVRVTRSGTGLPVSGASVSTAHVTVAGETLCTTTGSPSYTLGTTDANGYVRVSMPWGNWRFTSGSTTTSPLLLDSPNTAEIPVSVVVP